MLKVTLFVSVFFLWVNAYSNDSVFYSDNHKDELNDVLLVAIYDGDEHVVRSLIKLGANANASDYLNNSALIYAIQGDFEDIAALLIENGADVNHKGYLGRTPLIESTRYNYFHLAEFLILNDAGIEADDIYGNTAVFYASALGNFFLVDMLLFYETDVNHSNKKEITPLHIACWYGQLEVAGLLLDAGADIEAKDIYGNTPLITAVIGENLEMAWYIIESGANIVELNNSEYDIFSIAALNKDYELLEFLLDYEVFPESYPEKNKSPQGIAILTNDKELLKLVKPYKEFKSKGLYFSHIVVEPKMHFNNNEFMLGFQSGIVESRFGLSIMLGYESRTNSRRVLIEAGENYFYQHWENRKAWFLTLNKHHILFLNEKLLSGIYYGLKGVYSYGYYRGTEKRPDSMFAPVPFAGLFFGNKWIRLTTGYEYLDTRQAEIPPHRYKIGLKFLIPIFDNKYTHVNYDLN